MNRKGGIRFLFLFLISWISCLWGSDFVIAGEFTYTTDFVDNLLNSYLANRESKTYLSNAYSSNFSLNPYESALKQSQLLHEEKLALALNGMEQYFNNLHCDISRAEFSEILNLYSKEYQKDLEFFSRQTKKTVSNSSKAYNSNKDKKNKMPGSKNAGTDTCIKYNTCLGKSRLDKGCIDAIVSLYTEEKTKAENNQNVSNANMGKEKFFNNSIEDSPYDIQYDISVIEKILYESVEIPDALVFYPLPGNNGKKEKKSVSPTKNNNTNKDTNGGQKNQTSSSMTSQNGNNLNGDTNSSKEDSTNAISQGKQIITDNKNTDNINILEENLGDEEFNNFMKGENYQMIDTDFGGKRCITEEEKQIQQEEKIKNRNLSDPILTLPDITNIIPSSQSPGNLSSKENSSGKPESSGKTPEKEENLDNPVQNSAQNGGGMGNPADKTQTEKQIEKAKTCLKKCEGYDSFSTKMTCRAKCLCGKFESQFYTANDKTLDLIGMELGPIVSLDFCMVPSNDKASSRKGGKVMSIEEILNEIRDLLNSLETSGELGLHEQQKEMLDAGVKSSEMKNGTNIKMNSQNATDGSLKTKSISPNIDNQNIEEALKNPNQYLVVQNAKIQRKSYTTENTNATIAVTQGNTEEPVEKTEGEDFLNTKTQATAESFKYDVIDNNQQSVASFNGIIHELSEVLKGIGESSISMMQNA